MKKHETKSSAGRAGNVIDDEIRDYAYHLYVQNGCLPGHDLEDWLEARACIEANIPKAHSRARLHHQRAAIKGRLQASWRLGPEVKERVDDILAPVGIGESV